MQGSDDTDDGRRRTLLRTLAAVGLAGAGITGTTGPVASHDGDPGRGRDRGQQGDRGRGRRGRGRGQEGFDEDHEEFTCRIEKDGRIVEERDAVGRCEVGDEVTFTGDVTFTAIDVTDANELLVSSRLQGTLAGDSSEEIDESFENVTLGRVGNLLTVRRSADPANLPTLEFDVSGLCLAVLGLQIHVETVLIDVGAIVDGNDLVSDVLRVAGKLLGRY